MRRAISRTGSDPSVIMARAAVTSAGRIEGGRPPLRPCLRASISPAVVRSRIKARSNWAMAPKTWKEHAARRGGVDILGQRHQPDLLALQLLSRSDQFLQRAGEAVELPHHERVAGTQHLAEDAGEFGTVVASTRRVFGEDPFATGAAQCVQLQVGVLVAGANPGIPDPHDRSIFSKPVIGIAFCEAGFQNSFDKWRTAGMRRRAGLPAGSSERKVFANSVSA